MAPFSQGAGLHQPIGMSVCIMYVCLYGYAWLRLAMYGYIWLCMAMFV